MLFKENKDFYPTPKEIAEKMCEFLDGSEEYVLEPSAGKGDLVDVLRKKVGNIDMCESDETLRAALLTKYDKEKLWAKKSALRDEERALERKMYVYNRETESYDNTLTDEEEKKLLAVQNELELFRKDRDFRLVAKDFLSYQTWKKYDAIVMNPPFSEGAKHLLKAISLMRYGGKIVCLLNKETITNPYTNERKLLRAKLSELDAEIEYQSMAFMSKETERKTMVEIAIIRLTVPETAGYESKIMEGLDKAEEVLDQQAQEATDVSTATGFVDCLIEQCAYETELGIRIYKEYEAILPYMCRDYDRKHYSGDMIELRCNGREFDPNEFTRTVRMKYWNKFFTNEQFKSVLTSNLSSSFNEVINDAGNYEFTKENILRVLENLASVMTTARVETIYELFDTLSKKHSWYPECEKNIHYYNGWASNKAHMVSDKKVILPIDGFSAYSWDKNKLDTYRVSQTISDIEKVFNYLAVGSEEIFSPTEAYRRINIASETGETKNITCRYFSLDFFKKGTCHIKFREETKPLIEKLNILGSMKKGWLPPSYGKKAYDDMDAAEKAVIDEFQGREAYEQVYRRMDYYLDRNAGFDNILAICDSNNQHLSNEIEGGPYEQ